MQPTSETDSSVVPLTPTPRCDLLLDPSPLLVAGRALWSGPVRRLVVYRDTVHDVEMYRSGPDVVVLYGEVPPPSGLTVRELQVLALIAEGRSNPETGALLGIGARTAASHVEHILTKTGCRNRVDAARTATSWGLLC